MFGTSPCKPLTFLNPTLTLFQSQTLNYIDVYIYNSDLIVTALTRLGFKFSRNGETVKIAHAH